MLSSGGGTWACGSGGSGAPTDAQYIVMTANGSLSAERALTSGDGVTIAQEPSIARISFDNTYVGGDLLASGGVFTIQPNTVALGVDTTGNFAAGDAEFGAATSGDSATTFFPSGTIEVARGGTALASVSNDAILVGNNGGTGYDQPALPNCTDSSGNHLNYTAANGSFSCGTSSSVASVWQTTSNVANLVTSSDNVTVGHTANLAKLAVDGDADEVQLLAQAHSAQTAKVFTVENNAASDLFTVSNDGSTVAASYGQFGGTDQSVLTEGLVVNNGNGTDEDDDFTVKASGGTYEVDAGAGTFISSTNDLGWTVQTAANQACTTTCTSACVFGEDTSVLGVFVSCSDATADKCLCAGAS